MLTNRRLSDFLYLFRGICVPRVVVSPLVYRSPCEAHHREPRYLAGRENRGFKKERRRTARIARRGILLERVSLSLSLNSSLAGPKQRARCCIVFIARRDTIIPRDKRSGTFRYREIRTKQRAFPLIRRFAKQQRPWKGRSIADRFAEREEERVTAKSSNLSTGRKSARKRVRCALNRIQVALETIINVLRDIRINGRTGVQSEFHSGHSRISNANIECLNIAFNCD
jgi:hypothetical protein